MASMANISIFHHMKTFDFLVFLRREPLARNGLKGQPDWIPPIHGEYIKKITIINKSN